MGIGGSNMLDSAKPVASASAQKPKLYNPVQLPCWEWDLQKAALERFLAKTETPADQMQAAMRTIEQRYQAATGQSLLRAEDKWPPEYRQLFVVLNYVIAERNAARQSLKTMNKSEGNAALHHGLSNGKTSLTYCQPELTL